MKNTIAIIGAGSGISQAVAHRFGQEGYDVVLVARNAAHLRKLVAKLQAAGITATSAVADSGQPDRLKKALAGVDGLRVVHYNAAILRNTEVLAKTVERLTQDFAVSMAGLLTAVKAALPQLEAHQGSVLLTSGGLARHPHPAYASLALGKAAQSNLATSLSQVLQPKGVYVGVLQITAQVSDTDAVHNPTAIAQHLWAMHTDRTALEEAVYDEHTGRLLNPDLGDYHVPVQADIHTIDVHFPDVPDPHATLGVKSVGEIGIVGAAAAVANAVYHATSIRVRDLPITTDKLL